ncbi:MAG: coenzyme F420-0:L-glutamate ligase [Patescibacteria group bacterium]
MKLSAIKVRRLEPPQDNFFQALDEVLPPLQENDVIAVASKAVAIHEGRCVPKGSNEGDKTQRNLLIQKESDYIIKTPTPNSWDLTIKNHMVTFAGGLDESNAGEYYILLPKDPMRSARDIRAHLQKKHNVKNLGVVITDSTALPFRQGVIALSIGFAGFKPVNDYVGKPDLFGRPFVWTYVNVVDSIAVAAAFEMGETDESTPVCIVRDIPRITFTDEDVAQELLINPPDDVFYPLFKDFYKPEW